MLIQYLVCYVFADQLNFLVHQRFFILHLASIPKGMILGRNQPYQQENHGKPLLLIEFAKQF